MYKKQIYIIEEEMKNCQKVIAAFTDLFETEDLIVLDAGRYGFVKLQFFKFPFGFDSIFSFYDSKSLFDELWKEWLYSQLLAFAADTPMENMDYPDIMRCLPSDTRQELLNQQILFAQKTGIDGILEKSKPDFWSDEYMNKIRNWSQDWEHFNWTQIREKLSNAKEKYHEGGTVGKSDIGISLDELKEYFEWLHDTKPELYFATILDMALIKAGLSPEGSQNRTNS